MDTKISDLKASIDEYETLVALMDSYWYEKCWKVPTDLFTDYTFTKWPEFSKPVFLKSYGYLQD